MEVDGFVKLGEWRYTEAMKVALVHDYLTEYGGAERTLEAIHEIWPEAPVFTSLLDEKKFEEFGDVKGIKRFKGLAKVFTFFMPLVFENMDLREYDLVISDGTIWSKSVLTTPEQLHIHYCHTPPRWLYGYPGETDRRRLWYLQPILKPLDNWLRVWDFESAQRPDFIVANSKTVGERVRKFWRRDSKVIYPPVDLAFRAGPSSAASSEPRELHSGNPCSIVNNEGANPNVSLADPSVANASSGISLRADEYFLVVSRPSAYKNIDLAIEACNKLNLPLVIVGTGREEKRLKAMAGKNVRFMNFVEEKELSGIYKHCKALIFPVSDEDFGIVPVEAMSFGKPVIALRSGGATETIIEGKTGTFFTQPTVESLTAAIKRFSPLRSEDCIAQAQKFSKERFQHQFKSFVEEKWRDKMSKNKSVTQ